MKRIKVILLFFCYMQIAMAQGGGPGGDGPPPIKDSNLVKAIQRSFPQTFDNNRFLPEVAANITGDLDCSNSSISFLEGIQFFPRLRSINLRKNNIQYVPNLFGPGVEWQSLDLDSNLLEYLPTLNLGRLKQLDVSHNQLSGITSLDGQPSLEVFNCSDNKLSSLPYNLFGNNRNLKQLNISNNNKLQRLPNLGNNKDLETLDISNTSVVVPPLKSLPNLTHVDLRGAIFTFADLQPFTSTFNLPQSRNLVTSRDTTMLENQTLVLKTNVDKGVQGMNYSWYKEDKLIGTVTNDSFLLTNIQLNQAGTYYCKITNSNTKVSGCTLITNTFKVSVNTCLDISKAYVTITGINCQQNGSIQVKMNTQSGHDLTYTLKSSLTTLTSKDGLFKGLTEPSYQLLISNGPNCQKAFPEPILIPTQECIEAFMTLDNDGEKDTYYFAQQGPVKIYSTNGTLIKTLSAPAHWDGSTKTSSRVAPGYYLADVNNGEAMVKITVVY